MNVATAAALSTHPDPAVAVGEIVGAVTEELGERTGELGERTGELGERTEELGERTGELGERTEELDSEHGPDLAIVFASGRRIHDLPQIIDAVRQLLRPGVTLAISCSGLVGGGEEVESGDAVSLWAAHLGTAVQGVRLEAHSITEHGAPAVFGLPSLATNADEPPPVLLVLADPFTFPADSLFDALRVAAPDTSVVGGLASAGRSPGENRLWVDSAEYRDGAVGVVLPGDIIDVVVSQGCRPIGEPWVVTEGSGQMIGRLGGRPALERVNEMIEALEPEDRVLAARGLHIGIVADERRDRFRTGDFLIRGVLGAGRDSGAVAVGTQVEIGQVVQFQVRDGVSASQELDSLLSVADADVGPSGTEPAAGALVFTCNGRGTHMFPELHHDASRVAETTVGGVAGMFCAGELGPVGTQNAVHGFTATIVRFGSGPRR